MTVIKTVIWLAKSNTTDSRMISLSVIINIIWHKMLWFLSTWPNKQQKSKLYTVANMLSICGLQTEWGPFPAGIPVSPSMSLHPFFPALCFAQSQKSAKVLHSTKIASHSKTAFYILHKMLVLRERLGKMQGNTGSDLEYLTQKSYSCSWLLMIFSCILPC